MKTTKAMLLSLVLLLSLNSFAQDTTKKDVPKERCAITNEIGINATDLMKQVLSLSSNTFTLLPYDLTYKLIFKNCAIRAGVGVYINNSQVSSTSTTTSQVIVTPGPDQVVPNITNTATIFYRAGWEHRFMLGQRFTAYAGLDVIGKYGKTFTQSCNINNNLPSNYNYYKDKDNATTTAFGGGPVAGIQFFLTKQLSIFTEVPIYFQYSYQKSIIDDFTDNWQESYLTYTYSFVTTETKQTNKTIGKGFQLVLPVTIYLALKF